MSNQSNQSSALQDQVYTQESTLPQKRRWLNRLSLRVKLIILFILFAIIPAAIIVYFSVVSMQSALSEIAGRALLVAASETASDVDDFVKNNLNAVQTEAQLPTLVEYLRLSPEQRVEKQVELRETLMRLRSKDVDNILSYALLDKDGRNLVDTTTSNIDIYESENEYFTAPMEKGQLYVSPVLFDPETDEPVIYFSSAVRVNEGIIGVLRVAYDPVVLQQIITEQNNITGNRSFAILLDDNNVLLAHGFNPNLVYKSIGQLHPVQMEALQFKKRLPSGSLQSISTDLVELEQSLSRMESTESYITGQFLSDDTVSIAAVEGLDSPPWTVVFLQPQGVLLAPIVRQNFEEIVIVIAVLGLAVAIAFGLARRLTSPIQELIDIAKQVSTGALGLDIPVSPQYEAGELAVNFRSLVGQLRDLHNSMEQRIATRTQTLETVVNSLAASSRIGREITTIFDLDELLNSVVSHIRSEFELYYCSQIYLVDDETGELVLTHSAGKVGKQLLAEGIRIGVGEGIIGSAAASNEYFLANDVSRTPQYIPHPVLSETLSELALPLRKGNRVLGVLDIQSRKIDRFLATDIPLLQTVANQTAVAIENARLVAETQTALEEVERLNRRLTREGWDDISEETTVQGYRFSHGKNMVITPDSDFWLPPMKTAATEKQMIKQTHPGNGNPAESELAVPLMLRGEVIGVLGIKREETQDWAEDEVSAVEAVADQLTRALENARLSQEQEKTIIQLQEIDRLKSEFLTSMSHELRTPLNSIIGFADVIIQGIDGELPDLAMNDVTLIHNSGQHLLALINDILDINKIEAGMMELIREPLDINETVGDVLAASSSLVKDKPVKILTDISEKLPEIFADKLRLNQILLNLISNAVKFTHEGSVTIKAVVDEQDTDRARISIIDTGIGIPSDKLGTIFDRFRQADSSTTREYGGTGLGLAICRQLVELHEGKLDVRSEVGIGSEFYFTIPLASAEEQEV